MAPPGKDTMTRRISKTCFAFLFAALPVACTLDATNSGAEIDRSSATEAPTLQLAPSTPETGLFGTYSKNGESISFEAVRGPVHEGAPNDAEHEVDVRFLDQDGRTFKVRIAGHGFVNPDWQQDLEAEYEAQDAGKVDHERRVRAFALLEDAARALDAQVVEGMELERTSVVEAGLAKRDLGRSTMTDDLSEAHGVDVEKLEANGPPALEMPEYRVLGSSSDPFAGRLEKNIRTKDHPRTCSGGNQFVHYAEVRYLHDEIGWKGIDYEHSATLLRSICDSCGTVVLEIEHCNHGTCALAPNMKSNCHGMWGRRGSALKGTDGCKTGYSFFPDNGYHVCNDDSLLQYTEVQTQSLYDAKQGTCSDDYLRKWAPSCKDGYPYALRLQKVINWTGWDDWDNLEPVTIGSSPYLVRHRPPSSSAGDTIEVKQMVNGIPGNRVDLQQDTGASVNWRLVKPIETTQGVVLLTYQYGRLMIREMNSNGRIGTTLYDGPMPATSDWHWDMVESYQAGGKTFVVFHDSVKLSAGFPQGIGVVAIYELTSSGVLTPTGFTLQDPDLSVHVFSTSNGDFLLRNSNGKLESLRLTDTGNIGSVVQVFNGGTMGRLWDEIETFDNAEGTFVTFYKRGGYSCGYSGSTPCQQSGEVITRRVYRDGILGYELGSFDWPTPDGDLELETINIGQDPYMIAFQPKSGRFESYRLNPR